MHLIVRSAAIVAASVLTLSLASGAAMAGGAQEEANRKTVLAFYEKGLNQKDADAALAYVGDRYVQHNPNAADGPDGFRKFIGFLRENSRTRTARSSAASWMATTSSCTFTRFASPAAGAMRSSTSSSWRTARLSNTGTSCNRSRKIRRTTTRCSDGSNRLLGRRPSSSSPARSRDVRHRLFRWRGY